MSTGDHILHKFVKLEEALEEANTLAQLLNSVGYYAQPRRIVGMLVLALSMLRRLGYDWREIERGVVDLIRTMEKYEHSLEGVVYKSDLA